MKCYLPLKRNDFNTIFADRINHNRDTESVSTLNNKDEIPLDELLSPQNLKDKKLLMETIGPFETINMEFSSGDNKIKINQLQGFVKRGRGAIPQVLQTGCNSSRFCKVLLFSHTVHSVDQFDDCGILNLNALKKSRHFFL